MRKKLLTLSLLSLGFAANAQIWTSQATAFSATDRILQEIKIVDANTVWGLAADGSGNNANVQEFTRTTDGGNNWTAGTINVGNTTLLVSNLSPVSTTTAWVGAVNPTAYGIGGVYKTTDGGISWTKQNPTAFSSSSSFFDNLHFFDVNTGVAIGDPKTGTLDFEAYRTTDGGTNWTSMASALPNVISGEAAYTHGLITAGNSLWFTTTKGKLYRTTDYGVTWTKLNTPLTDFEGATSAGIVRFSDNLNGIIVGTPDGTSINLYKTTDGGNTWSTGVPFTGTRLILSYIPGTSTIVGTSSDPAGTSFSADNGTTWTEVESIDSRGVSAFLDANTGWCSGISIDEHTDGIFKLTGQLANEQFIASKFQIYPNPSSSLVTISNQQLDPFKLRVTDLTGKVILTKEFNNIENTVDISNFANGLYFFEVNLGKQSETIKIMKN